jgi:hypothetical protein
MNPSTVSAATPFVTRFGLLATLAAVSLSPAKADLVAFWDMNTPGINGVQPDIRAGLPARLLGGAVLTGDTEGRTGLAGDKAARFGTAAQRLHYADNGYFTAAAAGNTLSVSFWIKQAAIRNSTALSFVAPATLGARGFQSHAPWGNNTIYFDTGGCCDATMRTSIANAVDYTTWHHFTLVKEVDNKYIYFDGSLLTMGVNTAPIATAITDLFIGNAPNAAEGVNGDIDDFAVYSHALSATDAFELSTGVSPTALTGVSPGDTDTDGLPDMWELRFFPGDLTQLTGSAQDKDSDGLLNGNELLSGTNPNLSDTDGDTLSDGVETGTGVWINASSTGTSPFSTDSDGDTLRDDSETNTGVFVSVANTGTNPNTRDYDGDLIEDGAEIAYGSNPVDAGNTPIVPGIPTLLAWWQFDDFTNAPYPRDARARLIGSLAGASGYSNDAEGGSGLPGDRALRITAGGGKMTNVSGVWSNIATRLDKLTVSYWIKVSSQTASSACWFTSPSSNNATRGFQAHCPYNGTTVYFDTAGCCNADQRLSGVISGITWANQWHHCVLLKDGSAKRLYIDGVERLSSTGNAPLPQDFTTLTVGADQGNGSILGWLDDFAVFAAPLTQQEITDLATRAKTPLQIGASQDTDTDGIYDVWEYIYFPADLSKLGAEPADLDNDGSTDVSEFTRSTNPTDSDSDDDTLPDGVETGTGTWISASSRGTNPRSVDSDSDGLRDNVETNTGTYVSPSDTGTNPNLKDSDADTFPDALEIAYQTDPTKIASVPFSPGQTFLLAHWPFNDSSNPAAASDIVAGFPGAVTGTYSADAGGHGGGAGDKAMCFVPNQTVTVDGRFLSLASPGDAITVSFWQKLNTVRASSAFFATSPSAASAADPNGRGLQAHAPWSDSTIYFDHSGCCDAGVHRIFGPLPAIDVAQWHHFAFLKTGSTKQVYVDGILAVDGAGGLPLANDFTTLTIGGGPPGYTDGCIDDFAIFAGGLTHAQICRLAAHEAPAAVLIPVPGTGLFEITAVQLLPNDRIRLTWNSNPGCTYRVEMSDSLESNTWSMLATNIPSAGISTTSDVQLPAGQDRVFVRVTEL